jgi:gliding motility-associated-like protein
VVSAIAPVTVLEGGTVQVQTQITGTGLQYLWTPGNSISSITYLNNPTIANPTISANTDQDLLYALTVTGQGGCVDQSAPAYLVVKILKMPVIPNAFSPNGDGIHDVWDVQYLNSYPGCTVEVFNRYGQVVFSSTGYNTPWNGTFKGSTLPVGTYYYIIDPKNGRKKMSGYVVILR